MAKKKNDSPVDLGAELRKRIKAVTAELTMLQIELGECINHRAHLKPYYTGKIERAEAELAYLRGLLDG